MARKSQMCCGTFRFGFSALDMHLNLGLGVDLVLGLGLGLYTKQGLDRSLRKAVHISCAQVSSKGLSTVPQAGVKRKARS